MQILNKTNEGRMCSEQNANWRLDMSELTIDIIIAAVTFIVIVAVIAVVFKKIRGQSCQYDERQKLVRGKGYQISFITVILLNFLYACFLYGITKDIVAPQLVVMAIGFIGVMVYSVYCVFNDAYLQVGQNYGYGRWSALLVLVVIVNLIAAYFNREEGIIVNGFATGFSMNLMIAIIFLVILVSVMIKAILDKKGAAHEES